MASPRASRATGSLRSTPSRVVPPAVRPRPVIHRDVAKAEKMVPPVGRLPLRLFPRTFSPRSQDRRAAARDPGTAGPAVRDQNWCTASYGLALRSGRRPTSDAAGVPDQGAHSFVGHRSVLAVPEPSIKIWARGYFITTLTGPSGGRAYIRGDSTSCRRRTPTSGWPGLVVDSTMEFAMQDVNTIEATHSALRRANQQFRSATGMLIRNFHKAYGTRQRLPIGRRKQES